MTYKIKEQNREYAILSYGTNEINTIKVPKELIPFWCNSETILYYKNGKFNRKV